MWLKISILTLLLLCCSYSFAFDKEGVAADLLVVATGNYLLQYQENGTNKGPTIEILHAILSESQLTADIVFMPWARAFSEARLNANTLILSMIRTSAREHQFHWLIKVSSTARVFISLKDKPENAVTTSEQAKAKLTAVIRNSAGHKELVSQGFSEQENLYLVADENQMLSLFVNGKVDLLYTDPSLVYNYLAKQPRQNIEIHFQKEKADNPLESYIAANINTDKKLFKRLKVASAKFQKKPQYQYLLTK